MFYLFAIPAVLLFFATPVVFLVAIIMSICRRPSRGKWWISCGASVVLFIVFMALAVVTSCDHEYEVVKEVPATCTEDGYVEYYCVKCEGTDREYEDSLGHRLKIVSRLEPTEHLVGEIVRKCDRCGYEEIETVEKTPVTTAKLPEMTRVESADTTVAATVQTSPVTTSAPETTSPVEEETSVPVPERVVSGETYVSPDAEIVLMRIAEDMAKQAVQNPATIKFSTFAWGFARTDYIYAVQGTFSCANLMGVREEHVIRVWCEASEDFRKIQPYKIEMDGVVLVDTSVG